MIFTFLSHISKEFFRSPSAGRNTSMRIAVALIAVVVLGYSLALAFALERIIVSGLQQAQPIRFLNGMLVYYFMGEFITRYFIQSLPVLNVNPYLHLPIRRSWVINFLLARSVVHVANIFVFILFTPFALTVVADSYGLGKAWTWLLSIWFTSMTIHFVCVLVKKRLHENAWMAVSVIIVFSAVAIADYYHLLSLYELSEETFTYILERPGLVVLVGMLPVIAYVVAFFMFIRRVYTDEISLQASDRFPSPQWKFLTRFGSIGSWVRLELKLIARHNRTRGVFMVFLPFFASLLIFCSRIQNPHAYGTFMSIGIMGTGLIAVNYGQFLFSWQAEHFDFMLTRPVLLRTYVESKYWLLSAVTGLSFLLSIPLLYFGGMFLLGAFVACLYNIGINIFITMNMAMWGASRISLSANGTWNYEGAGAAQWLLSIPFIVTPFLFYFPLSLLGYPVAGLLAVGLVGTTGIVFRRKLLDVTTRRLAAKQYLLASNFRHN